MTEVRLIGVTQPGTLGLNGNYFDPNIKTPEDIMIYCARVSNPANQNNMETGPKLLKYCIKNKHWSVFETVSVTMEITTTRDIARQILRHRSFSFQEFCIAEGTLITTVIPSSGLPNYIPIERLYKNQKNKSYRKLNLRVYDEKTKQFCTAKFKEIFNTGIKPVYKITLSDGKEIVCTKEHKFLTQNGFSSLEEIVGLNSVYHTMSKDGYVAVNGVPVYQSKEWLKEKRDIGLTYSEIGNLAGVSEHTIHKWVGRLGLSDATTAQKRSAQTQKRLYGGVWNKGKYGYNTKMVVTEEHKQKIRKARSGKNSNWWKGGVDRGFRQEVGDFCNKHRKHIYEKFNYTCQKCFQKGGKLQIHHIIPVFEDKSKAFELNNLISLCKECHDKEHALSGHAKIWRQKHKGNTLTVKYVKIDKIEFVGNKQTYDIEIENENHNYVANKIVVHNSQRYAVSESYEFRSARKQDTKNRQNSLEIEENDPIHYEWHSKQYDLINAAMDAYKWALENGIAKEQARAVLPEGMIQTKLYMSGTLRSWITYVSLREKSGTQAEHMEVAWMCKKILGNVFPHTVEALGGINNEWIV